MATLNVNFDEDSFNVEFGNRGPRGPAGENAVARAYDVNTNYSRGSMVYNTSSDIFSSAVDANQGNDLTDTAFWTPLGLEAGAVAQLDDLTDVTIDTPVNKQILEYNGTMWVNVVNSGGSTPINPSQEKLSLNLNPSSVTLGTGTTLVTATPSISDGFTINSVNYDVRDQDNHPLTVTPAGNNATFTVDDSTPGHVTVNLGIAYTRDSDSTTGTDSISQTISVREPWYQALVATAPTDVATMTSQGVWSSPKTNTVTANDSGRDLYVALPTNDAPYTFVGGIVTYTTTSLGAISTDFSLFRIEDFHDDQDGATFIYTVEEL